MAKKTSRSIIAIVGGIIAIFGVVLGIFIKELGWWNMLTDVLGNVEYTDVFTTAFFGDDRTYFSSELTYLLPGIIAGVGAMLCLSGNKVLSLVGGIAVFVGMGLFMILLGDSWVGGLAELAGKNPFSGTFLVFKWRLGIGFYITGGGGLLTSIGGLARQKNREN